MRKDKYLILNGTEYLIIDELNYNGKKYIYINSMLDENEIAIVEEYQENGKVMVKSIDKKDFDLIMNKFAEKLINK